MAKQKQIYICSACAAEFPKWSGCCTACGEWNTIAEKRETPLPRQTPQARLLSQVDSEKAKRLVTGISEFNLVCGGGLAAGSLVLMGGEPGIGKSTMALQAAGCFNTLYISGEETPAQIKARAERLGTDTGKIKVSADKTVQAIERLADIEKPELLIIDSIQTISSQELSGIAGSVNQIRESTFKLADIAKRLNIPVIIIGHITKDGAIAGPKLLEHIVDTVLYFEGDFSRDFRILRSFKNRYGSVNEVGLFRMTPKGLEEVRDKNSIFFNADSNSSPGTAISAAIEGSRTILFEVQSLVSFTTYPNPRRMADGFDINRLIILAAVLEKHAGLKLSSFDIFINTGGGFHAAETAADLAVAAAIASGLRNRPLPKGTGLIGEIALSGDLRPVSHCERRALEFKSSAFKKIICSAQDAEKARASGFSGEVFGAATVEQALNEILN